METSSRPSEAARVATLCGCRPRFSANRLHETLGITRSAIPTAELVSNKSNGAASSSAAAGFVATTVLFLLECGFSHECASEQALVRRFADVASARHQRLAAALQRQP